MMRTSEPVLVWTALGQFLAVVAEQVQPAGGVWHGVMAALTAFVARAKVRPHRG